MKFSLETFPNEPIKDILELIKLAENIGFENVWITDHYNNSGMFLKYYQLQHMKQVQ